MKAVKNHFPKVPRRLEEFGGWFLTVAKAQSVVASTRETVGVPVTQGVGYELNFIADTILALRKQAQDLEHIVERSSSQRPVVKLLSPAFGKATMAVLYWECGDPGQYSCGPAYVKAGS